MQGIFPPRGSMREPTTHTIRVSRMSRKGMFATFGCFLVLFAVCLIIGALGPGVLKVVDNEEKLLCTGADCQISWDGTIKNMSPLNQLIYISAEVRRPKLVSGSEAFEKTAIDFPLSYKIAVNTSMTDVVLEPELQTRMVHCPPGPYCERVSIFALPFVKYRDYHFRVEFDGPWKGFAEINSDLNYADDQNALSVRMTTVARPYTRFEVGWKYFFFSASLVLAIAYYCFLRPVPMRARSFEQPWVMWLLIGLTLFNDPFFAAGLYSPSFFWPGINVFLSISFLTLLLLFILCEFDVTRKAADSQTNHSGRLQLGNTFWIPKAILLSAFWVSASAVSMATLYRLSEDPAFNLWDQEPIGMYLTGFTAAIAAIYLLWLGAYILLNFSTIRRMPAAFKFIYALSCCTIICVVAIYWAGGLIPGKPDGSFKFLAAYGIVNLYVWFMAFITIPDMKTARFDDELSAEREQLDRAAEEAHINIDEIAFSDDDDDIEMNMKPDHGTSRHTFAIEEDEDVADVSSPGAMTSQRRS